MKNEVTVDTIRSLPSRGELETFASWLCDWLKRDETGESRTLTESRARALLRVSDLIDEATLQDFGQHLEYDAFMRVALYDLLQETRAMDEEEIRSLARASISGESKPVDWLSLVVAAYAWRSGYPVQQLDPAAPPNPNTPAGQLLRRAAQFFRRQVQRSATERDKLNRILTRPATGARTLDDLQPEGGTIAPLPPHFRPPIPESYPEVAAETLHVEPEEAVEPPAITVGDPLVISSDDLEDETNHASELVRMPPITIERDQVARRASAPPSPMPESAVVMPASPATSQSRPSLAVSLREMFRQEELTSTKLRVIVQHYPDGPGLYGLQVRVSCKGVRSYVAGTTDRDGRFNCELPVRVRSGLTYDVDVTWPREEGGETERKSITLHADRTHFDLPFYRHLDAPDEV